MSVSDNEKKVLARAARILEREVKAMDNDILTAPNLVIDLIQARVGVLEHEVFGMLLLNNRHALLTNGVVELFRGTIDSCCVYPRECLKTVLEYNAAAVILYHNHPSLISVDPSDTDLRLTRKLQDAFSSIDVRLLDHFVVAGNNYASFAERGLM